MRALRAQDLDAQSVRPRSTMQCAKSALCNRQNQHVGKCNKKKAPEDKLDSADDNNDPPFRPSGLGMPLVDFKETSKTSKSGQLEQPSEEEMSINDGSALIKKLGLKRRKVKGDGSCWVYAILECAGLLDHGHSRTEQTPTPMDRAKDKFCRILSVTWLRQHGKTMLQLNEKDEETVESFLKTPVYPLQTDSDYGTFGNNVSIAGLVPHVKRTIILWDKTSLRNPVARQQVIEYTEYAIAPASICERVWDVKQVADYIKKGNEPLHLEWNGFDHYAALVHSTPNSIDEGFKAMLSTLAPVTRAKSTAQLVSSDEFSAEDDDDDEDDAKERDAAADEVTADTAVVVPSRDWHSGYGCRGQAVEAANEQANEQDEGEAKEDKEDKKDKEEKDDKKVVRSYAWDMEFVVTSPRVTFVHRACVHRICSRRQKRKWRRWSPRHRAFFVLRLSRSEPSWMPRSTR